MYNAWRDPWSDDTNEYRAKRALTFARAARDFAKYPGTSGPRLVRALQDYRAGAFAEDDAVAVPIKGAHGRTRVIIPLGKNAQGTGRRHGAREYRRFRGANHRGVHLAEADLIATPGECVQSGGASARDGNCRSPERGSANNDHSGR